MSTKSDQERARESEEARARLLRRAAERGVKPFASEDLRGADFWPDDESTDDFLKWLREARDEDGRGRGSPE